MQPCTLQLLSHTFHSRACARVCVLVYSQGHAIDPFYVLDALSDAADADVAALLTAARPVAVRFVNESDDSLRQTLEDALYDRQMLQFGRLRVCMDLMEEAERRLRARYDWLVRSRPDVRAHPRSDPTTQSTHIRRLHAPCPHGFSYGRALSPPSTRRWA